MSSEPEPQLEPYPSTENWNRQLLGNLGLLIYIFFLVFGLYFSYLVFGTQVSAIFTLPMMDFVPFHSLGPNLDCPVLMTRGETGTLTTLVENRFPESAGYTVKVTAYQTGQSERTGGLVLFSDPEDTSAATSNGGHTFTTSGTIPAYGAAKVAWKLRVTHRLGDAVMVNVYAHTDRTVYTDTCGITLINLPGLTGRQLIWLVVLGMPLGGLLWLYARVPLRCRGYATLVIGVLLWLFILWILNGLSLTSTI